MNRESVKRVLGERVLRPWWALRRRMQAARKALRRAALRNRDFTVLSDNCFGDYYTRKGLNYQQREMITFCFLAAQGGCEPQLTSHAGANMRIGNDKAFLIQIISQCLPYIGYPRSLNALRCVNEAAAK